jgi:predicted Fe-Mo cluster-binding NifX family protein
MKIAFATNDERTITQHFGRAQYYLVATIRDGKVTERETREKPAHGKHQGHGHSHDHEHEHGDNVVQLQDIKPHRGHGKGQRPGHGHANMVRPVADCDMVVARGMGQGAYNALQSANLEAVLTEVVLIEDALQAYLDEKLAHHPEKLH